MGQFLLPVDLEPFATIDAAKAAAMIEDAEAMAVLTAPCLPSLLVPAEGETAAQAALRTAKLGALKAILRGAILRWDEAGTGAHSSTQETVGPFSQTLSTDTRQQRRGMFWPSEIEQLQSLCAVTAAKAFVVDTAPCDLSAHLPWCSLMFGALYCSCGVDIAGFPIFELDGGV